MAKRNVLSLKRKIDLLKDIETLKHFESMNRHVSVYIQLNQYYFGHYFLYHNKMNSYTLYLLADV